MGKFRNPCAFPKGERHFYQGVRLPQMMWAPVGLRQRGEQTFDKVCAFFA
jgi:hypothetical protein